MDYRKDEYLAKNPSLHNVDSPWKVAMISPLVDRFVRTNNKDEINLLEVGGGAGLILNALSTYIEESYSVRVRKFLLDLSPGILEIQKARNPGFAKALNEDICKTSLSDKEIDLTLAIDVMEHVINPTKALEELKRISNFVIFKVPLEDNLSYKIWDFIRRGKPRQEQIKTVGHVNVYRCSKLKHEIEKHTGRVLHYYFANVFDYCQHSEHYKAKRPIRIKLRDSIGRYVFRLSPRLCSLIFGAPVMFLVECY